MKNCRRSRGQDGFAAVEAILLLIIVGAIVAVGLYVYQQKNSRDGQSATQSTTQQAGTDGTDTATSDPLLSDQTSVIEGDFIVYSNKNLNLTFKYPTRFVVSEGELQAGIALSSIDLGETQTGSLYRLGGIGLKKTGGVLTRNWTATEAYKNTGAVGFTEYESCLPSEWTITGSYTLYEVPGDVCVKLVSYEGDEWSNPDMPKTKVAEIVLQKKLDHPDVAGIEMLLASIADPESTGATYEDAIQEVNNNYRAQLSGDFTDFVVGVAKSMQPVN